MRYTDLEPTSSRRFRLPPSHPVLATITINAIDFHRFEQLGENQPEMKIINHDDLKNGMITVFVACSDQDVAMALEEGWA